MVRVLWESTIASIVAGSVTSWSRANVPGPASSHTTVAPVSDEIATGRAARTGIAAVAAEDGQRPTGSPAAASVERRLEVGSRGALGGPTAQK